jgi:hypothetical protein
MTIYRPGSHLIIPGARVSQPGGAAFAGAYDAIANLVHVYEPARRTLTSYTGNLVRLRRSSDDAESDFGYMGTGELNVAAIAAWLGGASGYVVTVYDQQGSDNITQATGTAQPLYVASAQNGHAGMSFDGGDLLSVDTGAVMAQPQTVFATAKMDAAGVDGSSRRLCHSGISAYLLYQSGANFVAYSGTSLTASAANSNWFVWAATFNGATSSTWYNGGLAVTGNMGTGTGQTVVWGGRATMSAFWLGLGTSLIWVTGAMVDADRIALRNAINTYWAVY